MPVKPWFIIRSEERWLQFGIDLLAGFVSGEHSVSDGELLTGIPAWGTMWGLSLVLYGVLKGISCSARTVPASVGLQAGYLLAWPGMDVDGFLGRTRSVAAPPTAREWGFAFCKLGWGGTLIWGVARRFVSQSEWCAGWVGMVGIIFVLHFGLFHVLSCAWRWNGVHAVPLMNWPIASQSLTEFWGRRWNLAFRDLTHRFLFQPLIRRFGPVGSLLIGFLVSGLIHDVVISVPARGGWGLPTLYFTLQGVAILIERSRWGRRIGLGTGLVGRLFCITIIALPSPLLFHSAFVHRVIVPFLQVIGALP